MTGFPHQQTSSTENHDGGESPLSLIWSFAFWCCLFSAAVLYGMLSLAPRMVMHEHLLRQYESRQQELVDLQKKVHDLERQVLDLERDPKFAEEFVRMELLEPRPERFLIEYDGPLEQEMVRVSQSVSGSVFWPRSVFALAEELSRSPRMRRDWSMASAALVVFAFLFLSNPEGTRKAAAGILLPVKMIVRRYQHEPEA